MSGVNWVQDLAVAAELFTITGGALVIGSPIIRRIVKRRRDNDATRLGVIVATAVDDIRTTVAALDGRIQRQDIELARQFGGNSNGLRQQINEMREDIVETRADVANLTGRFDQYVEDHAK